MPVQGEEGTQSWLHAVSGQGKGRILIAPTAQEHSEFYAQVEVEIEGAPADTRMGVTRALFTPGCVSVVQPWTTVATLQTSEAGGGSVHFVRDTPQPSGTTFYVIVRVSGGGAVLESDCIAVLVK